MCHNITKDLETAAERQQAFMAELVAALTRDGVALLVQRNGLHLFVHPSTKGYRWQITFYNDSGILSDTQHNDYDSMYSDLRSGRLVPASEIDARLMPFIEAEARFQERLKENNFQ